MKPKFPKCECSDPGCKAHEGNSDCSKRGLVKVARYDYETNGDHFRFCDECADDALESGVFTTE